MEDKADRGAVLVVDCEVQPEYLSRALPTQLEIVILCNGILESTHSQVLEMKNKSGLSKEILICPFYTQKAKAKPSYVLLPSSHCPHDPCCPLCLVLFRQEVGKFICGETKQFQGKFLKVLTLPQVYWHIQVFRSTPIKKT